MATKATLTARMATFVTEAWPARNYYRKTSYLNVSGTGPAQQALLYFANPFPRTGANVLKATLRLRTRQITATGTHSLNAYLVSAPVNFGTVTWNTKPKTVARVQTTKAGALALNSVWDIDVTPLLQRVADGTNFGALLLNGNDSDGVKLQGMVTGLAPQLIVDYSTSPLAPNGLSPSSGRSVGLPRPTLRWDFFDHVGDRDLASSQVQLATTSTFSTVRWDSGEVPSNLESMDLTETQTRADGTTTAAPTDPAVGVTTWWRVRCRDESGLWSPWSLPASYKYTPKAVTTTTNPDPSKGIITDPTPTFSWWAGGAIQTRWHAAVYRRGSDGKYRTHQTASGTGNAKEWAPTKPLYVGAHYRLVVQSWDATPREATPGDAPYSQAVTEFDVVETASVLQPTNIVITDRAPLPEVILDWTRTDTPDAWVIYLDNKVVGRRDGVDLLVGTGKYRLKVPKVPNGYHVWRLHAIVNGEASAGVYLGREHWHDGTWLINEDTGARLCIQNDRTHDMHAPEVSAVHEVLGASRVTLITEALRGYEGTLDGTLAPLKGFDQTPAQQRATAWAFKSDTGQEYRLLIEDQAFPVVIKDVDVVGDPERMTSYAFKCSWFQVDEVDWDTDPAGVA